MQVKKKCASNHKPYPLGMCNKCIPPGISLNRQVYRHVDYVSFMNNEELQKFVGNWKSIEQRCGWLYGWYAEDPNYKDGVRCIVEAIYEPPQLGEINGFQLLEDKFRRSVDRVAANLGFERIGWIFTSLNQDVILSSHQVREMARLQQEHIVEHPWGYKVSKFVTVVVKRSSYLPS